MIFLLYIVICYSIVNKSSHIIFFKNLSSAKIFTTKIGLKYEEIMHNSGSYFFSLYHTILFLRDFGFSDNLSKTFMTTDLPTIFRKTLDHRIREFFKRNPWHWVETIIKKSLTSGSGTIYQRKTLIQVQRHFLLKSLTPDLATIFRTKSLTPGSARIFQKILGPGSVTDFVNKPWPRIQRQFFRVQSQLF